MDLTHPLCAVGYNAIVAHERVTFSIAGQARHMAAYTHFADVDDRKTRFGLDPEYRGSEQAGPKVVPAQGALTHWTAYQPLNVVCDNRSGPACNPAVNSVEFSVGTLEFLKAASRIDLTFSALVLGQKAPQTVSCWINGTYVDLPTLKDRGFHALDCYPQVPDA